MSPDAAGLLNGFLDQLTYEKRASIHTVSNYRRDLTVLSLYCDDKTIPDWTGLTQNDIRAHIASRHRKGIGAKSLQRELSAIRSFFSFLLKNRLADVNPCATY